MAESLAAYEVLKRIEGKLDLMIKLLTPDLQKCERADPEPPQREPTQKLAHDALIEGMELMFAALGKSMKK